MTFRRRSLFGAALLTIVPATLVNAQPEAPRSPTPVNRAGANLTLSATCNSSIKLDGEIELKAELICNSGICQIYEPLRFGSLGLQFWIEHGNGERVESPAPLQIHPLAPQQPLSQCNFTKLYAGSIVGAFIRRRASDVFPAVGTYKLQLIYLSPISGSQLTTDDAALAAEVVFTENGAIFAPLLSVEVR